MDVEQHDILVVVALHGDFRAVVERIEAVAEIVSAARRKVKQLVRQRGRRKEIPLRGLVYALFRNEHGLFTLLSCIIAEFTQIRKGVRENA